MTIGPRADALAQVEAGERWDLIVVGGGITGTGILREAVRAGLKTLLIEQGDFASGTSSRSSKMVHGGLRYLGQGAFKMTYSALRERERLLAEAPGLIERMPVVFTLRKGKFPGRRVFAVLLAIYDRLAGINDHHFVPLDELRERAPGITTGGLSGAFYYTDALTDDARLVLRILGESVARGGVAVNYMCAEGLVENSEHEVRGVAARDLVSGKTFELRARAVINATGAWADELRGRVVDERQLRPLRGSHLLVSAERLPVRDAVTLFHPEDGRPVFVFPWLGVTVIGTTDLDHDASLAHEPAINRGEVDYLLAVTTDQFTAAAICETDVISTLAGVRPVINSGKGKDPSKEKREEAVWVDRGLVSVSGGKLTTFRPIALAALRAVAPMLGAEFSEPGGDAAVFERAVPANLVAQLPAARRAELAGRYGADIGDYLEAAAGAGRDAASTQAPLGGTPYSLADLRYALRHEMVEHLDDLLLRRTRLGNLLPEGGAALLGEIGELCRDELGWDDARWMQEHDRYLKIWHDCYSLPA